MLPIAINWKKLSIQSFSNKGRKHFLCSLKRTEDILTSRNGRMQPKCVSIADRQRISPCFASAVGIRRIDTTIFPISVYTCRSRPVDFVCTYLNISLHLIFSGFFQQITSAHYVGLNKLHRGLHTPVDKGFRTEIYHYIDPFTDSTDIATQISIHQT